MKTIPWFIALLWLLPIPALAAATEGDYVFGQGMGALIRQQLEAGKTPEREERLHFINPRQPEAKDGKAAQPGSTPAAQKPQ